MAIANNSQAPAVYAATQERLSAELKRPPRRYWVDRLAAMTLTGISR